MIEWNDNLKLGIATIDDQHKKWIEIMNVLLAGIRLPNKEQQVHEALYDMLAYSQFHFAYEERLLKEHGYTEEPGHLEQHRLFREKIASFKEAALSGNTPLLSVVLAEMNDWLIQHICVEDRKYAEFLKSKGVI